MSPRIAFLLLFVLFPLEAPAAVLSGTFSALGTVESFSWGDNQNNLTEYFSTHDPREGSQSIWLYGSGYLPQYPELYDAGVIDPRTVEDASQFSFYPERNISANEGTTVFFRAGGIYGAWVLTDLTQVPVPTSPFCAAHPEACAPPGSTFTTQLNGTWYWSDSPNFTQPVAAVPEPSSLLLFAMGLAISRVAIRGRGRDTSVWPARTRAR